MALLAPQDWHPPRDHTMDLPASSPSSSLPRQRSSPANDHSPSHTPPSQQQQQHQQQQQQLQQQQQPYPYPVQQQQPQGGWTPSIAAQPFYPSFYQGPQQQQPYPMHGHPGSPSPQVPQQGGPYFDPAANAQLAQWAYQQMMFNAQQAHQLSHLPPSSHQQRGGPNSPQGGDYFGQSSSPFNPFPSGTPPPPHPGHHHFPGTGQRTSEQQQQQPQYNGFHPYRRPNNRQASHSSETDWRAPPGSFQPPYARTDASASSSSVNSVGSRQRTNSNQSSGGSANNVSNPSGSTRNRNGVPPISTAVNNRSGSNSSAPSPSTSNAQPQRPNHRTQLSSSSSTSSGARSSSSSATSRPSPASTSSSSTASTSHVNPVARPARPSPLSQGNFTAAEKRMSRDDSDLATMLEPAPSASMIRSGGLKGRIRRALSLNAANALREEEESSDAPAKASRPDARAGAMLPGASNPPPDGMDATDAASTATVQTKKKSRAASLFNSRLNASTDNISLSSTVSSASVMIRKLGSMGKLARRNSLAGITSLFKDKKDKEDAEGGGSKKDKKDKKKSSKGDVSEASISHATAELDRSSTGDWSVSGEMSGLSPAAKLARQHTLKSNAEAAARAKAQQEAAAAAAQTNGTVVPSTWEKNTTTRTENSPMKAGGVARVNEDGTRVLIEDDDSGSENGSADGHADQTYTTEGWDDDEDWGEGEEEEDVTIRVGLDRTNLTGDGEEVAEPWAVDVRRSVERTRKPTKGILKHAGSYDQHSYLADNTNRVRSNSYNSHPGQTSELGPLARIPSPDPDHIDGLHRHPSHSSSHSHTAPTPPPFISSLPFEPNGGPGTDSPKEMSSSEAAPSHPEKSIFNHPNLNSSAPALSTLLTSPPTLTHRAATAPAKRLAFANNLSVYDTFSASAYDRRSEPATWSRLTPALAQRIKEELNSYKMEEMEVHAASRIHTQFFV